MTLAEAKALDAQRRNKRDHLRTLLSMIPGFQARVPEEVEDGFSAFCRRLFALFSDLAEGQRRGVGVALKKSMAPLREIIEAFKTEFAGSSLKTGRNSSAS